MHIVSISEMKEIVKHAAFGLHEPLMFIGGFGVGKTAGIYEVCEEVGALCVPILLGQYDTVDLKGTPWVRSRTIENGEKVNEVYQDTVWHPASTLPFKGNPDFPTDKPILLFLDELTSATVPVLGICYQLIQERRVGEHVLMDNVEVVAAGNRESDKGIVTRMPMPLCNRQTWFEVGVDVNALCDHAQRKGWPAVFIAFWQFRKHLVCTYDPAKPEKVVATPRTWEKAKKYYESSMPENLKMACMAGAIGEGPAAEFWSFVDVWQNVGKLMKQIVKEPEKATVPEEASMQYAVSIAISGSLDVNNASTYHKFLKRMAPEFIVLAWSMAVKRDKKLFNCDEFFAFAQQYRVVFQS